MTGTELNALINLKCKTNDTTFTPADKLVYVNLFKDEIASKIIDIDEGYFLIPSTFDLVADQREYAFDNDMLNVMQKLEIKFTSTEARKPSTYIKDYLGSETESEIIKNFSNSEKEFAHVIRRRALFILSGTIISVTDGGRLWYAIFPADLANLTGSTGLEIDPSTTSFGFPRQFHELLARRVSVEWKGNQPKQIKLNIKELAYGSELQDALDALSPLDKSGEVIASDPPSEDTGNSGFNY